MDKNEQRRLEREKRQARIRAAGGSRLAKITGVAGTEDYKAPVDLSARPQTQLELPSSGSPLAGSAPSAGNSAANSTTNSAANSLADGAAAGDAQAAALAGSLADGPMADFMNDPLFAMLANQGRGADGVLPDGTPQKQTAAQAQAYQRSVSRVNIEYWWNFVYFLTSVGVGLYAARVDPWVAPKLFLGAQAALLGVRVVLGHHDHGMPMISMLAPLIGMLPANRKRQLGVVAGLIGALRLAYWSFAVIVFVYGLASGGGAQFDRTVHLSI